MHPRPFRLKLDASLLAGANWMSMLCLLLTYVGAESAAYVLVGAVNRMD